MCPRPRSHFTRLHGLKESAMCHVPPCPVTERWSTGSTVKTRHTNIYSHTNRKPFDIKLLVFRGKSQRNFLFYTRRKNYFHIRLTSILQRAPSNGSAVPGLPTALTHCPTPVSPVTAREKKRFVFSCRRRRGSYLPRPGLLGGSRATLLC